jgi:uncharacterized protein YraI
MKYLKVLAGLLVALAALPATSHAQLAYAAKQANLRAGPGPDYPVVAILLAGVPVTVQGCLSDYRWCDVMAGTNRGWIYAANIVYPYQGSNVPVISYGAVLGIGILAFSVASYWDHHYVGRPWYAQRQRWIGRPPPPVAPGRHRPAPPEHRPPVGAHPPQQFQRPGDGPRILPQGQHPRAEQRPVQRGQEPREGGHRPPGGQLPGGRSQP